MRFINFDTYLLRFHFGKKERAVVKESSTNGKNMFGGILLSPMVGPIMTHPLSSSLKTTQNLEDNVPHEKGLLVESNAGHKC